MVALAEATLEALGPEVRAPAYDRERLTTGVVHVGVGGFHRAHQALYHDRLLEDGGSPGWAICGIGVRPDDRAMQAALDAQDGLYTLMVRHPGGDVDLRVIGSLASYVFAPEEPERALEKLADPGTRIVTLTITEGGYRGAALDEGDGPTAFGLLVDALAHRRASGIAPFAVLSCDNLMGNGDLARAAVATVAARRDPELARWIEAAVAFPNSVVDRITPATTDADRAELRERAGIEDRWPVVCEPFSLWVLEDVVDRSERPPYEDAGVRVVADVRPYELMKLRLLNAGHQVLAYFGRLCGHTYVHEAVADPLIRDLLVGYLEQEATPTLGGVPPAALAEYRDALLGRFGNAAISDTLARLAVDASDRLPEFLLPVVREQLASGGEFWRGAAVVASWARWASGADETGEPIEIEDPRRERLMAAAARRREDPGAFLADRELFGSLGEDPRFAAAYGSVLASLDANGAKATLAGFAKRAAG